MRTIKIYCDRCGKEAEEDYPHEGDGAAFYYHMKQLFIDGKYIDLCDECIRELKEWCGGKNGTDLEDKKNRY